MATRIVWSRGALPGLLAILLASCRVAVPTASPSVPPSLSPPTPSVVPTRSLTPNHPGGWANIDIRGLDIRAMAGGAGRVVAVGTTRVPGHADLERMLIAVSDDGIRFTPAVLPEVARHTGTISTVAFGVGGFVARGGWCDQATRACHSFFLQSVDGLTWRAIEFTGPCARSDSILTGEWGYAIVGGSCIGDDAIDPRPFHVLTSADGTEWTSTAAISAFEDPTRWPGPVATDGHRLVAIQGIHQVGASELIWSSDDGGLTWRTLDHALDPDVSAYAITYGHGRWLANGSRPSTPGNPDRLLCTSFDGEQWTCETKAVDVWLMAITPTGFAALSSRFRDTSSHETETFQQTSLDGVHWNEKTAGPPNVSLYGIVATAFGVYAWGGTNPDQDPSGYSQPFLIVHALPFP